MYILEISHLTKSFAKHQVLKNVSLQVPRGQVFGFLGPNGAGKTTLIRVVLGLIRPEQGTVLLAGYNTRTEFKKAIAKVGAVVETPKFFDALSGYQNLILVKNLHRHVTAARIQEVLELTGLTERADDKVATYSLGMKQRLGIARALVNYPELIFLDEPMNGLDPQGIIEVRALIQALRRQGITVFITSHLLHEVEQVCDQIAIIQNGAIITQGRLDELLRQETEVVEIYTSQPAAAAERLQKVSYVKKCSVCEDRLLVEIEKGASAALNRLLVTDNLQVNYLIPRKHSLEEFFIELAYGDRRS